MAVSANTTDQIIQQFANHGPAIQAALLNGASDLFSGLAVIELVWLVGWSVAHKTDIFDIIIAVTRFSIIVGFWFWLMRNWVQISKAITDSFELFGNNAVTAAGGTAKLSPYDFITAGETLAYALWDAMALSTPLTNLALYYGGVAVVIVFGLIASAMVLVLIEAFLASYLGTVLMAFNASNFTRGFGQSPIRYAIAVGVKLMTLQFIAGITEATVLNWANTINVNGAPGWKGVILMMMMSIIRLVLGWQAPKIAQDIIVGSHISTGPGIVQAARMVAGATAQAFTSAVGGGAAGVAAYRLAGRQVSAMTAAGTAPANAAARAATVARLTASNAASGVASDVGKRLSGSYSASHGYSGFRVAADLNKQKK